MSKKKDLKESLSSGRKADITHMRTPLLVYGARACEYGDAKYERANYARSMDSTKEDFQRLREYLSACLRHVNATLDSMEYHQAEDPDLNDIAGMQRAAYAVDEDAKPGQAVGASRLPHLCGAVASLNMAITQATRAGLLPADPGRPWEESTLRQALPKLFEGEYGYLVRPSSAEVLFNPRAATTEEEALTILRNKKCRK